MTWHEHAVCRQYEADMWYPETPGAMKSLGAQAKRICRTECPVREECLAAALEEEAHANRIDWSPLSGGNRYGIRGGLGPDERAKLARKGGAA